MACSWLGCPPPSRKSRTSSHIDIACLDLVKTSETCYAGCGVGTYQDKLIRVRRRKRPLDGFGKSSSSSSVRRFDVVSIRRRLPAHLNLDHTTSLPPPSSILTLPHSCLPLASSLLSLMECPAVVPTATLLNAIALAPPSPLYSPFNIFVCPKPALLGP